MSECGPHMYPPPTRRRGPTDDDGVGVGVGVGVALAVAAAANAMVVVEGVALAEMLSE